MRITLSDIAARIGVSKKTVSLALHNSPRISMRRRQQIQQLAEKMGYVPDPFLSGLAKYRAETLAAKSHALIAWLNHWKNPEQLCRYREFELNRRGAD